jgi:transposase-like protein
MGKAIVFGLLERETGKVRTHHVSTRRKGELQNHIRENVEAGSHVYTDAPKSYDGLQEYTHKVIDHAEAYVDGVVHTNRLENFWSLLKRAIRARTLVLSHSIYSDTLMSNRSVITSGRQPTRSDLPKC